MAVGLAPLHLQSPLKLSEAGGTRTKSWDSLLYPSLESGSLCGPHIHTQRMLSVDGPRSTHGWWCEGQ